MFQFVGLHIEIFEHLLYSFSLSCVCECDTKLFHLDQSCVGVVYTELLCGSDCLHFNLVLSLDSVFVWRTS